MPGYDPLDQYVILTLGITTVFIYTITTTGFVIRFRDTLIELHNDTHTIIDPTNTRTARDNAAARIPTHIHTLEQLTRPGYPTLFGCATPAGAATVEHITRQARTALAHHYAHTNR